MLNFYQNNKRFLLLLEITFKRNQLITKVITFQNIAIFGGGQHGEVHGICLMMKKKVFKNF